ncbi:hypothetical protein N9W89_12550 [Hellea sp.]|nr:hypothetical protein [Hellea sp.]
MRKTSLKGLFAALAVAATGLILTMPVTAKEAHESVIVDNYPARVIVSKNTISAKQGASYFGPSDEPFPDVLTMESRGGEGTYFKFSQLAPLRGKKTASTDILLNALDSCQNNLQTKNLHRFTISLEVEGVTLPAGDYHVLCLQGVQE